MRPEIQKHEKICLDPKESLADPVQWMVSPHSIPFSACLFKFKTQSIPQGFLTLLQGQLHDWHLQTIYNCEQENKSRD